MPWCWAPSFMYTQQRGRSNGIEGGLSYLPRIDSVQCSLPRPAWTARHSWRLLNLFLSLVPKGYNINNTQKHKMYLKLPLRAVTPELPQSSHLEHFWRQENDWLVNSVSDLAWSVLLHYIVSTTGVGLRILHLPKTDFLVIFVTEKSYKAFTEVLINLLHLGYLFSMCLDKMARKNLLLSKEFGILIFFMLIFLTSAKIRTKTLSIKSSKTTNITAGGQGKLSY